jgi:hypothetical protein
MLDSQADLFRGLPADNLYSSRTTLKFVRERLSKLLEAGAFIDCHVQSYEVDIPGEEEGDAADDESGDESQIEMSEDLRASQMNSQDLAAFFAPDFYQAYGQQQEGARRAATKRRVYQLTNVQFKLQ